MHKSTESGIINPEESLNDTQKAFRDKIAEYGPEGINSDDFNKLLSDSGLSAEEWRKMLDYQIFTFKRLAMEDRCMVASLLDKTEK